MKKKKQNDGFASTSIKQRKKKEVRSVNTKHSCVQGKRRQLTPKNRKEKVIQFL